MKTLQLALVMMCFEDIVRVALFILLTILVMKFSH